VGIDAITWQLGPWEAFWMVFYGFATWGNAGFMREQVCKYMCPYARFQGVMFDKDTLVITYDARRGEPRGSRRKGVDPRAQGLGDCVDCNICVQVCPTGIDIRNGLQIECIGCAACIDGCDQVMDKMGYPKGLIRYTTQNALAKGYDAKTVWRRVFRLRTMVYSAVLIVIAATAATSLVTRNPLKVDVLRDRGALAREAAPGVIENVYRLQLMNTDETARRFTVRAEGFPGLEVVGVEQPIDLGAAQSRVLPVRLRAPAPENAASLTKAEPHPIEFVVEAVGDDKVVRHEKSTFIVPRQ
jgi:cytochrome c oxidase accessory protein FixG